MTAIAAARVSTRELTGRQRQSSPMKADAVIYQGTIVMLNASGLAIAGATATGAIAVGIARSNGGLGVWDATGLDDGDLDVEYDEGIFGPFVNGAGGDELVAGDEGKAAYVTDNQTVGKTNTSDTKSPAGRVHSVDALGVYLFMGRALAREIAESQVISTGQAYTQTYSTANRTIANPTATAPVALVDNSGGAAADGTIAVVTVPAALTLTDGAGTNDGTIGAITDNASTIAAVQELAANEASLRTAIIALKDAVAELAAKSTTHNTAITALVADDLDNRQTVTALIDDLQTAGVIS